MRDCRIPCTPQTLWWLEHRLQICTALVDRHSPTVPRRLPMTKDYQLGRNWQHLRTIGFHCHLKSCKANTEARMISVTPSKFPLSTRETRLRECRRLLQVSLRRSLFSNSIRWAGLKPEINFKTLLLWDKMWGKGVRVIREATFQSRRMPSNPCLSSVMSRVIWSLKCLKVNHCMPTWAIMWSAQTPSSSRLTRTSFQFNRSRHWNSLWVSIAPVETRLQAISCRSNRTLPTLSKIDSRHKPRTISIRCPTRWSKSRPK